MPTTDDYSTVEEELWAYQDSAEVYMDASDQQRADLWAYVDAVQRGENPTAPVPKPMPLRPPPVPKPGQGGVA